jgi:hypothetical protein
MKSAIIDRNLTSLEDESQTEYPRHVILEKICSNAAQQPLQMPHFHCSSIQQLSLDEVATDCEDITLNEKEELGEFIFSY